MAEAKEKGPVAANVDEFVGTRVASPELRDAVELVRELMRECAPHFQETISYGIPAWRSRKIVAVVNVTKKDITVSFSRGTQFDDPYSLLRGEGVSSRHVKLKSRATANVEVLRWYIAQAVEMDKK